jgi:serine/threonine-protein kinase HipA
MSKELIAILDGREAGCVIQDKRGKLSLTYKEEWRTAANPYPISLSMPLAMAEHGSAKIDPYLWGLLPDNEIVLETWAQKFQVSARNAFALIAWVGEDCAGAIQFVRPEKLDAILGEAPAEIEWLDQAEIAQRLRALREDHAAWRIPRDTGQFSLAGAQPKTALYLENGKWGVPSGRVPTTHILKPPSGDFDGHVENEHFCLELGRALGLPVADSKIMRFGDEIAIVVERFDRVRTTDGVRRIHQEDICQALAVHPARKYESQGGPGIHELVDLLRTYSTNATDDIRTFVDATAYNWLIAGTDAHAKNFAVLIGPGQVRLAPLYDVASILPYREINMERAKLAMKLGGEYRLRNIYQPHWRKLGQQLRLDPEALINRVDDFARQLIDLIPDMKRRMTEEGLHHPILDRLAEALPARAAKCRIILESSAAKATLS